MLMSLGQFIFEINTAPFDNFKRQNAWRWPSNSRTTSTNAHQYTGQDEESIDLSGILMPELTGGTSHIQALREMADKGEPYLLISGAGQIFGYYIIVNLSEDRSYFLDDGTPQKIDFSLQLKRYHDRPVSTQ